MFRCKNIPKELEPLIEKWNHQGRNYYLAPDNMFFCNQHKIQYHGGQDIPMSGWFACNGNTEDNYILTRKDIEEIQKELLEYYRPIRWTLILDWHCNYQCKMCPYHGDGTLEKENYFEDRGGQKRVVTLEDAYKRIDRLAEYGIKILSVMSLGEILLYPYWKEVSGYAQSKGMELWTITNGSLWTEETVREAAALGYTNIRVSLDAVTFETYAKIRSDKKEHYVRAIKLPELLTEAGIITNVHFVKQKENLHEAELFLEYWKKKKVNSISIANEFCYENERVINKFALSNKEYIDGLCAAFGNMQTMADGSTVYCCGSIPQREQVGGKLEHTGCSDIVNKAIMDMGTADSEFKKSCRKCALYVPYNNEELIDDWKVIRNDERETWSRLQ